MVVVLCGKSASGKDTLLAELKNRQDFETIVSTTSRPVRTGETNGCEYNFVSKETFLNAIKAGEFLEYRSYDTLVNGNPDTWYYGYPKQTLNSLDSKKNYVAILDMSGAKKVVDYLGQENCFVCFISASKSIREERAKRRVSFDKTEWDRRAKDDDLKFADDIVRPLANVMITNDTGNIEVLFDKFVSAFTGFHERRM